MDNSWRYNIGVNNRYHSYIKPYWRPRFQSGPVPVNLIQEPFETHHAVWSPTPDMTSFKKHKSKATLSRDRIRMKIFCENKNMCSALPFAHLDDTQMKEVISVQFDSQPDSRKFKLKSASKIIKELKASFNLLNSTIQLLYKGREDDCERVKELVKLQDQEVSNLKNELENEKKTVHKFVAQNVERQREIVKLKRELAQSTTLHTQDSDKRLNNRASTAEKENEDPLKDRSVQIGIGT